MRSGARAVSKAERVGTGASSHRARGQGSAEVANFGELKIYHFRLMPATNGAYEPKSVTLGHAPPLQHDVNNFPFSLKFALQNCTFPFCGYYKTRTTALSYPLLGVNTTYILHLVAILPHLTDILFLAEGYTGDEEGEDGEYLKAADEHQRGVEPQQRSRERTESGGRGAVAEAVVADTGGAGEE